MPLNGNVRELANIVEKTLVMANFKAFDLAAVRQAARLEDQPEEETPMRSPGPCGRLAEAEKALILQALEECSGNRTAAAQRLGISPTTLWRRLKALRACP